MIVGIFATRKFRSIKAAPQYTLLYNQWKKCERYKALDLAGGDLDRIARFPDLITCDSFLEC